MALYGADALVKKAPFTEAPAATREFRGRDAGELVPTGAELQRLYAEQEQRKEREQLRHAAKGPRTQVFHMASAPVTPTPRSLCGSDAASDYDGDWTRGVRRGREPQVRSNRPLTVPQAPRLRTAERSRSASLRRSTSRGGSPAGSDAGSDANRWEKSLRSLSVRSTPRSACGTPRSGQSTPRTRTVRAPLYEHARPCSEAIAGYVGHTPRSTRLPTLGSLSQASASVCGRSSVSAKCRQSSRDRRDEVEMLEGRQHLSAMLRRNEVSCHRAIHCPDVHCFRSSTEATTPKEFNLSCPTSLQSQGRSRSLSLDSSSSSSSQARAWSASLRRPGQPSRQASPARSQTPQRTLTVPRGPALRTAQRPQSVRSLLRSGVASRPGAPATASAVPSAPESGVGGSAAERAKARAQAATDEGFDSIKDKLFVFKKDGTNSFLPRGGA